MGSECKQIAAFKPTSASKKKKRKVWPGRKRDQRLNVLPNGTSSACRFGILMRSFFFLYCCCLYYLSSDRAHEKPCCTCSYAKKFFSSIRINLYYSRQWTSVRKKCPHFFPMHLILIIIKKTIFPEWLCVHTCVWAGPWAWTFSSLVCIALCVEVVLFTYASSCAPDDRWNYISSSLLLCWCAHGTHWSSTMFAYLI